MPSALKKQQQRTNGIMPLSSSASAPHQTALLSFCVLPWLRQRGISYRHCTRLEICHLWQDLCQGCRQLLPDTCGTFITAFSKHLGIPRGEKRSTCFYGSIWELTHVKLLTLESSIKWYFWLKSHLSIILLSKMSALANLFSPLLPPTDLICLFS